MLVVICVKVWFSDICSALLGDLVVQSVADGAACSPWAVQPGLLASSALFYGACVGVGKGLLLSDYRRALLGDALQSNGDAF